VLVIHSATKAACAVPQKFHDSIEQCGCDNHRAASALLQELLFAGGWRTTDFRGVAALAALASVGTSYDRTPRSAVNRLKLLTMIGFVGVARFLLSKSLQRLSGRGVAPTRASSADATRHGSHITQGTLMAQSNDFSWSDEALIVVKRVDAIAVYKNPQGDIVIRQESRAGDEDNIVIVPAQYAYTLVESMQRLLKGQLFSLPVDPR
jgi:hypothetical protein